MRLLLFTTVLFAPVCLLSQEIIRFYGGSDQQKMVKPAGVLIPVTGDNPYTQYSIDIRFSRKPTAVSGDSLHCIFSTPKNSMRFKFPTGILTNLKRDEEHHFIVSRKENYLSFFIDNYPVSSLYDQHNLFDIRFPWFNLEFFAESIQADLLNAKSVLITAKPFDKPFLIVGAIKKGDKDPVSLFPNPAASSLHISFGELTVTKVMVYNSEGKEIMGMSISNKACFLTIPVNKLLPGVYMLRLFDANKILCTKLFIKQ
jgi:hypothetical protein